MHAFVHESAAVVCSMRECSSAPPFKTSNGAAHRAHLPEPPAPGASGAGTKHAPAATSRLRQPHEAPEAPGATAGAPRQESLTGARAFRGPEGLVRPCGRPWRKGGGKTKVVQNSAQAPVEPSAEFCGKSGDPRRARGQRGASGRQAGSNRSHDVTGFSVHSQRDRLHDATEPLRRGRSSGRGVADGTSADVLPHSQVPAVRRVAILPQPATMNGDATPSSW